MEIDHMFCCPFQIEQNEESIRTRDQEITDLSKKVSNFILFVFRLWANSRAANNKIIQVILGNDQNTSPINQKTARSKLERTS